MVLDRLCDNIYHRNCWKCNGIKMSLWFWIVCLITSTIAIVGNATVIYVVLTREVLRSTANIFISAASDLGVGFWTVPSLYFAIHYTSNEKTLEGFDFLHSIFFTASVLNLSVFDDHRTLHRHRFSDNNRRVIFLGWSLF